jgi:RHS repeat-associated protein
VGNIEQLQHQVNGSAVNRVFALAANSNRLATVTRGQTVYQYTYDFNGNLIQENGARHFEWDYGDRMRVYRTQAGTAEPSVHAHYLYDANGQRVKKLVRKQGGQVEVTVYIDGIFEHHVQGDTENNTVHVMDNQSRIALVRVGQPFADDTTPAVKYHLGDHLGSSNLVIDDAGSWVNREEHTPYGETSFGSFARKRYRFTGKERDEESGLYYHGARYYASWIGRWVSCDPKGMVDGTNLYAYVRGNPMGFIDPEGTDANGAEGSSGVDPNQPVPQTSGTSSELTKAQRIGNLVANKLWGATPVGFSYQTLNGAYQIGKDLGEGIYDTFIDAKGGIIEKTGKAAERLVRYLVAEPLTQAAAEVKEAAYSGDPVTMAENIDSAAQKVGGVAQTVTGIGAAGSRLSGIAKGSGRRIQIATKRESPYRISSKPKGETFYRISSEAEAIEASKTQRLNSRVWASRSIDRSPKRIFTLSNQSSDVFSRIAKAFGDKKQYSHLITITTESGTRNWIESQLGVGTNLIENEPGRFEINRFWRTPSGENALAPGPLDYFNHQIRQIEIQKIR